MDDDFVAFCVGAVLMFLLMLVLWQTGTTDISGAAYVVTDVEATFENRHVLVTVNDEWQYHLDPGADIRVGDTLYFVPTRHTH